MSVCFTEGKGIPPIIFLNVFRLQSTCKYIKGGWLRNKSEIENDNHVMKLLKHIHNLFFYYTTNIKMSLTQVFVAHLMHICTTLAKMEL